MNEILQALSGLVPLIVVLGQAGFGGGVMSLIVSVVVEADWDKRAKDTVAFMTCIIAAFLGCIVLGMDASNLPVLIPAMILACHLIYIKVWKPVGIAPWIEKLTEFNK